MKWTSVEDSKGLEFANEGEFTMFRFKTKGRFGPSASGKTTIVATSSGNKLVPGTTVTVGFNAYTKEAAKPAMKVRK
jgi:hypothetical protein